MAVEYLGSGNDDGTVLGHDATTAKVGFFGIATPVVKPQITAVATATATTTLNERKIDRLYAALLSLGLVGTGG